METNKKFHDNASIMFYHLDPRWCSRKDFDYMVDQGYVNALRLTMDGVGTTIHGCKKAKENGMPVWIVPPIYIPTKQTIDEYMAGIHKFVDKLKAAEVWDAVIGFQWDEPLLRKGHTNEALLEMTKAMSEAFGKRIFTNFSLYEIAGKRGNAGDPDFQWLLRKDCSKYITDVGFDLYGWDMRPDHQDELQESLKKRGEQEGVVLKTGTDLYQHYTDVMLRLVENADDVRIWYYPCAYKVKKDTDEGYCVGHLEGFKNLLLKQKHPGGLCVYTYKLNLEDHILPKCDGEPWEEYKKVCKEVCETLTNTKHNN